MRCGSEAWSCVLELRFVRCLDSVKYEFAIGCLNCVGRFGAVRSDVPFILSLVAVAVLNFKDCVLLRLSCVFVVNHRKYS